MDENYKEVYFGEYCHSCKWKKLAECEEPCFSCLDECVNVNSHKPVNWEDDDEL